MEYVESGRLCEYSFPVGYEVPKSFIVLSGRVKEIGSIAFDNYGAEKMVYIMLPKGLKKIEENAFSYCTNLKCLVIPKSTDCIEKHAIGYLRGGEKVEHFRIYGEKGSEAERYATENGFHFIPVDGIKAKFDDFTLDYYKTDAVKKELCDMVNYNFDWNVPKAGKKVEQLINEALSIQRTDCEGALRKLNIACWECMESQHDEMYSSGEKTPPLPPEEEIEKEYQIEKIRFCIANSHATEAALNGEWQTAHDYFEEAYRSCKGYSDCWEKHHGDKYNEIKRMLCKAIGTTSILLGDPVEALYWLEQETEFADKFYNIFSRIDFVEKMADAALLYGHIDAARWLCKAANAILNRKARKYGSGDHSINFREARVYGYTRYRLGFIDDDYTASAIAVEELEQYLYTIDLTEEERKKAEADLKRAKEVKYNLYKSGCSSI